MSTITTPVQPTAADVELAAFRDAQAAAAYTALLNAEMASIKMLAVGVLRQWPSATHLEMVGSYTGTGSNYPRAVMESVDDCGGGVVLAELEDEILVNGADPTGIGAQLEDDGFWTAFAVPAGDSDDRCYLDLLAVAAVTLPMLAAQS